MCYVLQLGAIEGREIQSGCPQDNSYRGGYAECSASHCDSDITIYLQQRRDGHPCHNLCSADECDSADLCLCDQTKITLSTLKVEDKIHILLQFIQVA